MAYATRLQGEPQLLDYPAIQRSAGATANQAYLEEYGVDKGSDPEWTIGGDRHTFWLKKFDSRWTALIINPFQD